MSTSGRALGALPETHMSVSGESIVIHESTLYYTSCGKGVVSMRSMEIYANLLAEKTSKSKGVSSVAAIRE